MMNHQVMLESEDRCLETEQISTPMRRVRQAIKTDDSFWGGRAIIL